jgi:deoxyribose-phosphate aldolase
MHLNKYIDHTLLNPTATSADFEELCLEAIKHRFYAVCIPPSYLPVAKSVLRDSDVKIATVIGFPLGSMSTEAKAFEAKDAVAKGADEIDMVLNIGKLKSWETDYVEKEITKIKKTIDSKVLKVIIETCYLTDSEKEAACRAALNAKADFVKTSTGFGPSGATFEDIKLIKKIVGNMLQIKASGGIKDRVSAIKYIELGVSRLGTSSGIKLVTR